MRGSVNGLFDVGTDNDRYHGRKIAKQINKVNRVKRTVNFYESGSTVDYSKGDLFVVNGQDVRACSNQKDKNRHSKQEFRQLFFIRGVGYIQDNH